MISLLSNYLNFRNGRFVGRMLVNSSFITCITRVLLVMTFEDNLRLWNVTNGELVTKLKDES